MSGPPARELTAPFYRIGETYVPTIDVFDGPGAMVSTLPAAAQVSFGVRAGASGGPDQFVFGGHIETAPLIEHLTFRPNIELGVGDHVTLVALNVEFAYWIPIPNQPWRVYVGAGPAANVISYDGTRGQGDRTNIEGGFNLAVGVQHERGLFTELKVGVIDSPDIKVSVGWAFR